MPDDTPISAALQAELDEITGTHRIVEFEKAKGLPVYNAIFEDGILWPVFRNGNGLDFKVQCHGMGYGTIHLHRYTHKRRVGRPTFGGSVNDLPIEKTVTYQPTLMWWLGKQGFGVSIMRPEGFSDIPSAVIHGIEAFRIWLDADDRAAFWRQQNYHPADPRSGAEYWEGTKDTFRSLGIEMRDLPPKPDDWE